MANRPHVLVVGAGIVGASLAWHLARAGARVTIIEAGAVAGGVATANSFAWLNASWGNPEPYFRLRIRSMALWRKLESEVTGLRVAWTGGLIWDLPEEELDRFAREHAAWGYGIRRVNRMEAATIEPRLATPPELALHVAEEGSVEPLVASRALAAAAQSGGAVLVTGRRVEALRVENDSVTGVETDAGPIVADQVVVAAGVETAALLKTANLDLPLDSPPGLLVASRPHERLLNGLVMSPQLHMRQTADGRLVAGSDFEGKDPGEDVAGAAADLFAAMRGMLRDGDRLEFERHLLGYRPIPGDGFPALGAAPGISGLYLAVTHSGMTLAPAIGLFLADEIMTGRREPLLEPYRFSRFARDTAAA